jgi:trans-2,3-dihydro-3-hydroxyanthranilate isomerase
MTIYPFVTVDVFTNKRFSGNPLAVFPNAFGLSDDEMQLIAKELSLSETTFVLPPTVARHTARVRMFTPVREVPFGGHSNVGTAFVLAQQILEHGHEKLPEHFTFEETAGLVRVHLMHDATGVVTGARVSAPKALSIGSTIDTVRIASCVGLHEHDIVTAHHAPLVASVGARFVLTEISDVATLARATPNVEAFRRNAAAVPTLEGRLSLLLYVRLDDSALRLRTRMFAPLNGVFEAPANGGGSAALAAFLTSAVPGENVELTYEVEQGTEMGRPSRLVAMARKTAEGPVVASVAGECVTAFTGTYVKS